MKTIQYTYIFCLCLIVIALVSCSETPKENDSLRFAFIPGISDPFYYTMERGIREKSRELGVTLIVADYPEIWDADAQIAVMEKVLRRQDVDLILIAPVSVDALNEPLKKLYERGIQIITVDTFLGDGDYSKESEYSFPLAYIGTDNELGGKKVAENLAKLLGEKGKVYINTTDVDTSSVAGRVEGFKAGIAEFPDMELVGTDYNDDVQERAQQQTLAALQATPDIVGVFGTNVFSAQGAYRAIVEAGLTGAVKIASWDATPDLIQALKDGQVDLVLAQKPAEIGMLGVEWGYRFFRQQVQVPKKVIPGFEFFTRENVNEPEMQEFIYQ